MIRRGAAAANPGRSDAPGRKRRWDVWARLLTPPRLRRGCSVEMRRGAAAAVTRIFSGDLRYRGRRPGLDAAWELAGLAPEGETAPSDVPRLWSDVSRVEELRWPITSAVVGRLLGGSGAANAMVYVRALPSDVEGWNATRWTWPAVAAARSRRADISRMNRGDAAAATWIFRGRYGAPDAAAAT